MTFLLREKYLRRFNLALCLFKLVVGDGHLLRLTLYLSLNLFELRRELRTDFHVLARQLCLQLEGLE